MGLGLRRLIAQFCWTMSFQIIFQQTFENSIWKGKQFEITIFFFTQNIFIGNMKFELSSVPVQIVLVTSTMHHKNSTKSVFDDFCNTLGCMLYRQHNTLFTPSE